MTITKSNTAWIWQLVRSFTPILRTWGAGQGRGRSTKKLFFSKIHFFANFVAFSPSGVSFSPSGALIPQSLSSQVSCSSLESVRSDSPASSLPFSSAKFKIAVTLYEAGTQRMADTCSGVQWRYKYSHSALFKLLTGGAATASMGRLHVSHWFEFLLLTLSWEKQQTRVENYAATPTVQFVVQSTLTLIEGQHRRRLAT